MLELTDIGNNFMIRHTEVGKKPITSSQDVDYLFQRMFAVVRLLLKGTGRGGYEHTPPRIRLEPLMAAFEAIAAHVCDIRRGDRIQTRRTGLVHPVHQQLLVVAWEVEPPTAIA